MSIYKELETNKNKESGGIWIPICENDDGSECRVKIKRLKASSKEYARLVAKKQRNKRGIGNRNRKIDEALEIHREVFFELCLVTWENVLDINNKKIPFTKENVLKVLEELPEFFELLQNEASDINNFKDAVSDEQNEVEAKNLQPS